MKSRLIRMKQSISEPRNSGSPDMSGSSVKHFGPTFYGQPTAVLASWNWSAETQSGLPLQSAVPQQLGAVAALNHYHGVLAAAPARSLSQLSGRRASSSSLGHPSSCLCSLRGFQTTGPTCPHDSQTSSWSHHLKMTDKRPPLRPVWSCSFKENTAQLPHHWLSCWLQDLSPPEEIMAGPPHLQRSAVADVF